MMHCVYIIQQADTFNSILSIYILKHTDFKKLYRIMYVYVGKL